MNINEIRRVLEPQFGFMGKSRGEPLFFHSFAVWAVLDKMLKYCPSVDEKERKILYFAALLHDIGKMNQDWQQAIKSDMDTLPAHKVTDENIIAEYLKNIELDDDLRPIGEELKNITDIIRTHHHCSDKDLYEISTTGSGFFSSLLIHADRLASMEYISYETLNKIKTIYEGKVQFASVEYSRFSSPTTILIIDTVVEQFKKEGWDVLLFLENSILFIGDANLQIPEKTAIIEIIFQGVLERSLEFQDSTPRSLTRDHLVLLSKEYPGLFLKCHKKSIMDALGNVDNKYLVFFKLLRDILFSKGLIKEARDKPFLEILNCANSPSSHKYVKQKIVELGFEPLEKVNHQTLEAVFKTVVLSDCIPESLNDLIDRYPAEKIRDLKPADLFIILETLSNLPSRNKIEVAASLKEYLNGIISMEEEIDFEKYALDIFRKYKEYKKTQKAEKGCCEICGCPVASKMQPKLNLSRSGKAFSQIKTADDYRGICAFCGYDNLSVRRGQKIRVFLRLETKVPPMLNYADEIKRLVNIINSGIKNPYSIRRFKEVFQLSGIPVPDRIEIPVSNREPDLDPEKISVWEKGILYEIDSLDKKDFSPKDVRAKYGGLYHLLRMMGFGVSIGTEEQELLVGENIESNERSYYKSLATVLLAAILKKKISKKKRLYLFSQNLIEKSPSIMITNIGESLEKGRITNDFIKCFFRYLKQSLLTEGKDERI
jgi:hypothetical protein